VRIALTHAFCWPEVRRGAERFLPSLGAALAGRGHDVVHYSAAFAPRRTLVDGVETIPMRRHFRDDYRHEAEFGLRLAPRLAAGRFDAVHSLGRHDALASIRAARLHPHRTTAITDLGLPNPQSWLRISRRDARAANAVVRKANVYSVMSHTALDWLARNYGREDGFVVPGGVDLGAFVPADEREPRPTVLFSGAFEFEAKGVATLLQAIALVAEREPDVEFWLSGPGDPEPLLAAGPQAARERTRFLGLGHADRQHERYGRAWATCLPSVTDSFGMSLLESLACGTPIVATTSGAPQELVQQGATGELCEPRDPGGLAQALLRAFALASNPRTAERCRASAEPFDWDTGLAPFCESLYRGESPAPIRFPSSPGERQQRAPEKPVPGSAG
jgi:glycosyltransferase involved in cell wall biosynthesis